MSEQERKMPYVWRRGGILACCLVLALTGLAGAASAAKDDLDLVSRAGGPTGVKGNDESLSPAISANGRFVAFDSIASNLDLADADATDDVFVRDLQTNTTTLVSRASGASGAKGNGPSAEAAISADGRFVAFDSVASNLTPDGNLNGNVYVRDLQTNTTTLVSRASGTNGVEGNAPSFTPAISADGRFVAFVSVASNLTPEGNLSGNVYVRDLQTNTTTLVSRASGANGAKGNAGSGGIAISAGGRFVVFQSSASNLDPADVDNNDDVFVRDLQTNTTMLVSRATGATGAKGNSFSVAPRISADGRVVAFESFASNLDPADMDTTGDLFVRDLQTNSTTLVSRAAGPAGTKGNDESRDAAISADGRFVAFDSSASNLDPTDGDTSGNVFVRDRQTNTTTLVSRRAGAAGVPGNGFSVFPAISAEGRFVAFYSSASNLTAADADTNPDVYRRDVLGPPAVPASRISINDLSIPEGNSGQTAFRFTVSIDRAQPAPMTVSFSTANATAIAPGDYVAGSGSVTFAPGETARPVTVRVNGDTTVEPNESFTVDLTNVAGNATIADVQGIGTIVNDDQAASGPPSRISIANTRRREGNRGRTAFRFRITLDRAQSAPVSVSVSTANGTAKAPRDYSPASRTVIFSRGETAKTITVLVRGDKTEEANEAFRVNLATPTGNATIADARALGTIVNDDRRRAMRRTNRRAP
jgi:Calx-beta domain-containing protein/WD40 repeat protein